MKKIGKIICTISATLCVGIGVAGDIVYSKYSGIIEDYITHGGSRDFNSDEFLEASSNSTELIKKIGEEGTVLLRNERNALPLSEEESKKINVFGWSSTDNGFILGGIGSGSTTFNEDKIVTLIDALNNAGIETNTELTEMYENYYQEDFSFSTGNTSRINIIEPPQSYYSDDLLYNCLKFSKTALVCISRVTGENTGEVPLKQPKKGSGVSEDSTRHFLEFSKEEEDLLNMVKENFEKVIVLINSSNQMELGYLEEIDVDAILNVGLMGQNGAEAIPEILLGNVSPSGRLTDTYVYDLLGDPSYKNYIRQGNNIQYIEDLYIGYKYYETADTMGVFDKVSSDYGDYYEGVVQYPFGYGLSYSEFSWKLTSTNVDSNFSLYGEDGKPQKIELEFSCTNVGDYAGKDVMEIYVSTPYYSGKIEKSSIQLVDFEKTATLEPGETQKNIKFEIDPYYFASFDCYDKNENGYTTYELDGGDYQIKFMDNAHTEKEMEGSQKSYVSFHIDDEYVYSKDPVTDYEVTTRFTGDSAYSGVPIDGTTIYSQSNYLSRSNLSSVSVSSTTLDETKISRANNYTSTYYDQEEMPTLNADNGLYLRTNEDGTKASKASLEKLNSTVVNEELVKEIGNNYDSEKLDLLVDQLSAEDACSLVENGGFGTYAIESIGKDKVSDFDGPAGFNTTVMGYSGTGWSAFPNETLIGQTWSKDIAYAFGKVIGNEGISTGVNGWYAPGVNLHRSAFNARNYEYYSEDGVLSGYLAANVVLGAKSKGLYVYVKHFSLSEPGQNSKNLNTWLTEQNYRENYLKPFEIAVKVGKANAMMTAFNSIGGVWAGANYAQNVEVLRNEWGFRGSVITDWSDGSGNMNTKKGVRAGNDIWLNPNDGNNASKLSRSDPTDVYCAKIAVKNVVYTWCNTYTYATSGEDSSTSIGKATVSDVYNWGPLALTFINIALFGGALVLIFIPFVLPILKNKFKKGKEEHTQNNE